MRDLFKLGHCPAWLHSVFEAGIFVVALRSCSVCGAASFPSDARDSCLTILVFYEALHP